MVLYDESELQQQKARTYITLLVIVGVIAMVILGTMLWNVIKPLPQFKDCKNRGFEAGISSHGKITCYNDCLGNTINTCDYREVIT